VHLVVRTPPAWADAGQRIGLGLWDVSDPGGGAHGHPHPRPNRRYRLDLHRHLWDARRAGELRERSGADRPAADRHGSAPGASRPRLPVPEGRRCAVDRWAAEAGILLRAEGRTGGGTGSGADGRAGGGAVMVRFGARQRLVLELAPDEGGAGNRGARDGVGGPPGWRIAAVSDGGGSELPVLPDAATWVPPDLELLRAGLLGSDRLHPLVASALVAGCWPRRPAPPPGAAEGWRIVECGGSRHRIGLVDGVLAPLDHDPAEIRREELLAALTGTPLPCLQAVDEAHRRPDCLPDVRERLNHGDTAGALAVVEDLLGPDAVLRNGALREALETAARRRIDYGLFRAGLAGPGPDHTRYGDRRPVRVGRSRPRHATTPR
jgi:hypothetical protein